MTDDHVDNVFCRFIKSGGSQRYCGIDTVLVLVTTMPTRTTENTCGRVMGSGSVFIPGLALHVPSKSLQILALISRSMLEVLSKAQQKKSGTHWMKLI